MRLFLLALGLVATPAMAGTPIQAGGNLGLGLGSGTHASGLSAKYHLSDGMALQGVVGWWGVGRGADNDGIGLSVDYLFEMPELAHTDPVNIAWNVGPGANLVLADAGLGLGINGVLGLEFNFNPVPIDLVLEYRPGIRVIPDVTADLIGFGAHIRIYPF